MKSISNKTRWLILALISIILSWSTYSVFYNTAIESEEIRFQEDFSALEKSQTNYKKSLENVVRRNTLSYIWSIEEFQESDYVIQIIRNDSLVYWNSNQINFEHKLKENDAHYVDAFSNGHYLIDQFNVHDLTVVLGSKIKNDFFFENSALKNKLTAAFSTTNDVTIHSKANENSVAIKSLNGEELFYLTVHQEKSLSTSKQFLIFCFYAFGFLCFFIAVTKSMIPLAKKYKWLIVVYPVSIVVLRYFSIKNAWIKLFSEFELYDPILYANSSLIPNLGSLILTMIFAAIIVWWVLYFLDTLKEDNRRGAAVLVIAYLFVLSFSGFISYIFESLIINSSISMKIDEVFTLSLYSVIALVIISFLFLAYYLLIRLVSLKLISSTIPLNILAILWFISGSVFIFIEIAFVQKNIFNALWPVLLNALFFYLATKNQRLNTFKYHIAIVIVVGFYGAIILFENNESNEHQKRELYANQLISDQDPNMEMEYASTMDQLIENDEFYQLLRDAELFNAPNLSSSIESCCFGDFWERYEMSFFFFQPDGTPLVDYISNQSKTIQEIKHLIQFHSTASSITDDLYFITDYYDQLSYIGHREITNVDGSKLDFYVLFKSKKIPEQIGFPRILMNEKTYALQDLEDYSIARYSKGELVMRFGSYNFPTTIEYFTGKMNVKTGFLTTGGMSHLVYQQNGGQAVVISKPEKRLIEKLSTFSYLVLFFGVFALIVLLFFNWRSIFPLTSLQLSLKVQVVLIGMVVGSFIVFAFVAIQNVSQQYSIYTNDNLKEKLYSVEIEIDQKIGDKDKLDPEVNGDYLNYILRKFSNVFITDINFYTLDGNLFATSQPKIYNKGLSAKQMNSQAFYAMNFNQRSEFIHKEDIGELSFLSAYLPYENHEGKLLGYINLQHFSKQNAFENQMNDFIVAVINIAVLLLVFTVVVAIFISGWITAPLRLIQQSFRKVELGKENTPIEYEGDDEIGALVKDYNNKLVELELKAMQLAQSERETAWREMAKQVAHEIKNPLTPMKLSVQHFQRSFDVNDPKAKEKMQRIANSLIEQINTLTKIANEFSNFAKMPKANEEELNLVPILHNIVDLYSSQDVRITLDLDEASEWIVFADRNLLLRVFNNLVKNAIQATPDGEITAILIACREDGSDYEISVHDQGTGIPIEIQKKMFSPNFTTKTTGSGLGLAMVKQIIMNHNGEVWFTSRLGEGTTFFIRLPKYNG